MLSCSFGPTRSNVAGKPRMIGKRLLRRWKEPSAALRYALAVVAITVATLITTSSLVSFGQTPPFLLAILVSGLFGGRGPALLAVLLSISAGAVWVFVYPPHLLAGFTVVALIIAWLSALQHETTQSLKRTNNELAKREAKTRRLVEANIIGIIIGDIEGRIIEANDAFLHMVGYDREDLASGRVNRTDLTPPEWRERDARAVAEVKATGTAQPFEKEYFCKDGSRVPVLIGVTAVDEKRDQGIGFVLDLTERKRSAEALSEMQMALTHATRVATLGQLTASIAHEVGQPIAAAVTNARVGLRLLGVHPPDLEEAREAFRDILKNGERTREIIDRIRGLVKKTQSRKERVNINDVIQDVIALTRSEVTGHRVSLKAELATDLPFIQGDPVQLQQVIVNLILNAVQSMSCNDDQARVLRISTEADASNGVLVTVRDTGPGLRPNDADRLFEAFYTTKPTGMGMGLSISRSIIEDHGGRLWASANVPRGAIFQFTVPTHSDGES
jgi:PAS domain S-box-containing protein